MNSNYPKTRRMAGCIFLLMLSLILSTATQANHTALEESGLSSHRQANATMLQKMDLKTSSEMLDLEILKPKCLVSDASRYVADDKKVMDDSGMRLAQKSEEDLLNELMGAMQPATQDDHSHAGPTIYSCPTHAEVISEAPGTCHICGKRLVEKSEEELLMDLMKAMRPATQDDQSHEESLVYSCPMHADVTSSEPGNCPICGMHLEEQTAQALPQDSLPPVQPDTHHEHTHAELVVYSCPMHPKALSDKPGNCPICGMLLVNKDEQKKMNEQMPAIKPATQDDHMHAQPVLYRCPTHAEVISEEPGPCPICGKQLIEKSEEGLLMDLMKAMQPATQQQQSHPEPVVFTCPMHPEVISEEQGSCPICGMHLVEKTAADLKTDPAQSSMQTETNRPAMQHDHDHDNLPSGLGSEPVDTRGQIQSFDRLPSSKPVSAAKQQTEQNQLLGDDKHPMDPTYICPMHPQIMQHEPGNCPICGMNLVVKQLEINDANHTTVTLSPAVVQNMGVRSSRVKRGKLTKTIHTQGKVTYDDDRIIQIHPRTAGWIENLYIRTDGVHVERKDDLADYFSPDVLWAQQDYISALKDSETDSFGSSGAPDQARRFRERSSGDLLRYFKVPNMDIMGLETSMQPRSIIPIKAPQGGVVIEHNVREGTFVTPADNIFTIVDLSEVWIMVDIFEHQLAWIRPGMKASVTTPSYPGRKWEGKVNFVYPEIDPKARTLRARVELQNPGELLMPNMFVKVDLSADTQKLAVLMVPREAVIITGEREVVVKALKSGRFQPVEVVSGLWNGSQAEIISGLEEGDEVVVSGQFLIDSESNLQASFLRMSE